MRALGLMPLVVTMFVVAFSSASLPWMLQLEEETESCYFAYAYLAPDGDSDNLGEPYQILQPTAGKLGFIYPLYDVIAETGFCLPDEKMHCMYGSQGVVAVPKADDSESWEYRGVRFEIAERVASLNVDGQDIGPAVRIRAPFVQPNQSSDWGSAREWGAIEFWYSRTRGMVTFAYEMRDQPPDPPLVAEGGVGIWAEEPPEPTCRSGQS